MKKVVAGVTVCAFLMACASAQKPIPMPKAELDSLPEPPPEEVPEGKDWVIAVEESEAVPEGKSGILMSEEKAALLAKYRVKYPEMRRWAKLEQQLWSGKWQITQRLLLESQRELEKKPGWWDRNKFEVGTAMGFVLGALATIAVVYGVQEVKK